MGKSHNISQPPQELLEAADFILRGGIGAVPTETVYGLAANALNPSAVRRIFEAKGRPFIDPLIVHVSDMEMARAAAHFTPEALKLAEHFWPGPFTLVLKRKDAIPDIVSAGLDTVALRMPSHPMTRALINACSVPIAAPSANPFGYISPTLAEHVREQLGNKIDFILDGGPCKCGVESTILMATCEPMKLLRAGPIAPAEIERVLGRPIDKNPKKNEAHPEAPGMLKSHYSPRSKLSLFDLPEEIPEAFKGEIIFLKRPEHPRKNEYWLSESGDEAEMAHNLFALLRSLDKFAKNGIYCQRPRADGIGLAVLDRLTRAKNS